MQCLLLLQEVTDGLTDEFSILDQELQAGLIKPKVSSPPCTPACTAQPVMHGFQHIKSIAAQSHVSVHCLETVGIYGV